MVTVEVSVLYLLIRGRNFKCAFEDAKKFYKKYFGHFASEEVVLNLLNTKCTSSIDAIGLYVIVVGLLRRTA